MDRLIKWAQLMALLSILPVAAYLCLFLRQLTMTASEVTATAQTANKTLLELPRTFDTRLESTQTQVLSQIDKIQIRLFGEVHNLVQKTDTRMGSIETKLFDSIDGARFDFNSQLTTTNQSVSTLVAAYAQVPAAVGSRYERDFNPYFDCKKNGLCIQGQATDTLFAIRDASRSTSKTMSGIKEIMPKVEGHILTISNTFATDIPKITTNFASITGNIDRLTKPKWYDRLIGYGLNGAIMYRNFNPATNLTLKGAQAIIK